MLERKIAIGICDDNVAALDSLKKIVTEYLDRNKEEGEVLLFQSGEDLLPHIESRDILFLDIEMPGMDGIEVGKHVAKKNPDCKIIMATSHIERFKETFTIGAFRFVSKPFEKGEVTAALKDALSLLIGWGQVTCYYNRRSSDIRERDIVLAVAYEGFTEIITQKGKYRKDISLTKLIDILDTRIFYPANRTYLVNMFYVEDYKNGVISVVNKSVTVSRRRRKDFEQRFREFDVMYRR